MKKNEVYKCKNTGLMIEVLEEGQAANLGENFVLMQENTVEASKEKHIPVIEKVEGGFQVTVGSVKHPMEAAHHIAWVELIADGKVYRQHLKVGEPPVALFKVDAQVVSAREYCNLHGLWKADFGKTSCCCCSCH